MRLSNSKLMRAADEEQIAAGTNSKELMLRAAAALAREAEELMGENRRAVIFCGSGNNGGDGIAAAAILLRQGVDCEVLLTGRRQSMTEDALAMEALLNEAGGVLLDFDPQDADLPRRLLKAGLIIDAMFGFGLNRKIEGRAAQAVELINSAPTPVLAADIPSGVSADTGEILGCAVRARATVTFSMAKIGHFAEPGCIYCGRLITEDIGIAAERLDRAATQVSAIVREDIFLPRRPRISHKGDYGELLIVGGCKGYTGAPNLCAHAAVRSGAGLVHLGVPEAIYDICAVKNDEAMPFPLSCDAEGRLSPDCMEKLRERLPRMDTLVLGPGLGRGEGLTQLVQSLIREFRGNLVLDADALFAVSKDRELLLAATLPPVITPHEGEFARLYPERSGDRIRDALAFSEKYNCITVLKGHRSVCAFPSGRVLINTTGNPGMAKGGSGDVLAGIVGALCGQFPAEAAVPLALWLHGRAGDLAAEALGEYSAAPTDTIAYLPQAMLEITKQED